MSILDAQERVPVPVLLRTNVEVEEDAARLAWIQALGGNARHGLAVLAISRGPFRGWRLGVATDSTTRLSQVLAFRTPEAGGM